MLNINRAVENDHLLRALTELNRKAFGQLYSLFKVVDQESIESDTKPQNEQGGAKPD
jgi:hypothetical protein